MADRTISVLVICTWVFVSFSRNLHFTAEAQNVKFNFNFSDSINTKGIKFTGNAKLNPGDGIKLTRSEWDDNFNWSSGCTQYGDPIQIWRKSCKTVASFQSQFQFVIKKGRETKNNFFADGLAFFMARVGSELPSNDSGSGMWLGLFNSTTNGKPSTSKVAIEFDTFQNAEPGPNLGLNPNDPDDNHVGLDINSITSVVTTHLTEKLNNGGTWDVLISYDGEHKQLKVYMSPNTSKVSFPADGDLKLTHELNLSDFLPEKVIVGFSASTGLSNQLHTIISWNFSSQFPCDDRGGVLIAVICPFAAALLVFIIGGGLFCLHKNKSKGQDIEGAAPRSGSVSGRVINDRRPREYSYGELKIATDEFNEELKLGQGGFGNVYKGTLQDGETVAVKKISQNSEQGIREYESEISILDRLAHPNLVPLLGWCHDRTGELLLVYEFMPNGSLNNFLFGGKDLIRRLNWRERYSIVCHLVSAMVYLHEESIPRVLHRDIKTSNIMLDSSFTARLGDFGLARLIEQDQTSHYTDPAGTLGYIAPECFHTRKVSAESAVFSFGAVALEIACGRRAVERDVRDHNMRLVEWVWDLYGKKRILDATDQFLDRKMYGREIERLMLVGLWCSSPDYTKRPKIKQALHALQFEGDVPILPCSIPREIPSSVGRRARRPLCMWLIGSIHSP